jgi:hypothetical protein
VVVEHLDRHRHGRRRPGADGPFEVRVAGDDGGQIDYWVT